MKKSSQTNRSALLMAGQNSLYKIDQQSKNYYKKTQNKNNPRSNQVLYQSNVQQVYKRPGYNNNQIPYYPSSKQQIQPKVNFRTNIQNTQTINESKINYDDKKNINRINNLGLKSQKQQNQTSPSQNIKKSYSFYKVDETRIKKIMMNLTFGRLRKIQALVRGFLVRRKVYPKLLEKYLIAKNVLSLIQANVVYREISTIIMETITFPKYQDQGQLVQMYKGRQKVIEDMIYETIVTRVIQKQMKPIIQESLTQRGLLLNRPQITFGFNLRDPLQLVLYEKLLSLMNIQLRFVCEQSIKQEALDRRQLFVIDQWIEKHSMVKQLYVQIANQLLQENIGEYIVDDIFKKMVRQGAFVAAQTIYNNQVNDWYMKTTQSIKNNVQEAIIEEAFSQALLQMRFGLEKNLENNSLL